MTDPGPVAGADRAAGPHHGARRWLQVAGVLALLGIMLAVVQALRPDEPLPVGRSMTTSPPTTVDPVWQVDELVDVEVDSDVAAAGEGHVLVGGRVVSTGGAVPDVRALPRAFGGTQAVDGDGTWAVPEGDVVTFGTLTGGEQAVELSVEVPVTDGPLAWARGQPVLQDAEGHLLLVQRDGSVLWRSEVAVTTLRAVTDRWVGGLDPSGRSVVVALADGAVTEVPGSVQAIVGDLAVLTQARTVGRDLASGRDVWQRPPDVGEWEVVGGELVLAGASRVERVDPATGATTGEVEGFSPVAVAGGAVVQGNGVLEATGWDGEPRWSVDLAVQATHRIQAVDAARVAVSSSSGGARVVTVLAADSGRELVRMAAPAVPVDTRVVEETVALDTIGGATFLDPASGEVVDARQRLAPPESDIATEFGPLRLTVSPTTMTADGARAGWRYTPGVPLATAPVPVVARLVVGLVDGTIVALDPARGTVQWSVDLEVLPTALAAHRDRVAVGTDDGRVVLLDGLGGSVGEQQYDAPVVGLALVDRRLVVVTADGGVRGVQLAE